MPPRWGQKARAAGLLLAALLGIVVLVIKNGQRLQIGSWTRTTVQSDERFVAHNEWQLPEKERHLDQSSTALFKALFQTGNKTSTRDRRGANETNSTNNGGMLNTTPNIVGGVPAKENPSYGFGGNGLCGATVIRSDILLTAAHCAGSFVNGVFIGGATLDGSSSIFIPVASELPHPRYDPTSITFDYDIMLVKLATPSTAPLQQINFDPIFPPVGSEVSVIGYGHTSENGTVSPILLQTQNTILSFEDCNEFYKTISEERMICMGDAAGGRDSCQGDSGGPMFYNGIQVGVVSFGDGCARPSVPSVFARTSGFQSWINNGICALSTDPQLPCDQAFTPTRTPSVEADEEDTAQPSVAMTSNPPGSVPVKSPIKTPLTMPARPPNKAPARPVLAPLITPVRPPKKGPARPVLSPWTTPIRPPNKRPMGPATSPIVSPSRPINGMGIGSGSGTGTGNGMGGGVMMNGMGMMRRRPMRTGGGGRPIMNGMGWASRRTDAPSPSVSSSSASMSIFGMGKGGGKSGKSGGGSGKGMMKGGRPSLWKLLVEKEDGRFRIEESEQHYIQPLVPRRQHHKVLEDWYREHVTKQNVND